MRPDSGQGRYQPATVRARDRLRQARAARDIVAALCPAAVGISV